MMAAPNCMDLAMTSNKWATLEDLDGLAEADRKNILNQALRDNLNSEVHNLVDLMFRDTSSDLGSLCAMSFMYKALYDTILTDTQLTTYTYDKMKETIVQELNLEASQASIITDVDLLEHFHNFIC